jgi:DNA-binding SARP family transcriptional activator
MLPQLELTLLGGVQCRCADKLISGFRSSKAMALLCYLAVSAMPVPRPLIADLFWPEMSESHANDSLRVTLSNLRSLVGTHLSITRHSVAFDLDAPHKVDVRDFRAILEGRTQVLHIKQVRAAVDLYRGDFLAGFHVHDAPTFEHWASTQQMQLRDLAVRALHTLVAYYTQQSADGRALAIEYGNRLLALEPWEEQTHQLVMLLLATCRQPAAAYRQYENCRRVLWRELGIEPSTETEEMAARINKGTLTVEDALRDVTALTMQLEMLPVLITGASTLAPPIDGPGEAVHPIYG